MTLGDCVRCFKPRRAVTVQRLSYSSSTYDLALCEEHADKFFTDMFGWSRCGELVEDYVSFAPAPAPVEERNLGRLVVSHLAVAPSVVEPEPRALPPKPRFDPVPLIDPSTWTWTEHARERATQRGVSDEEALWCAQHPDTIRDGDDGRKVHTRGPIKVVVDPHTRRIITVADRRYEDQESISNAS